MAWRWQRVVVQCTTRTAIGTIAHPHTGDQPREKIKRMRNARHLRVLPAGKGATGRGCQPGCSRAREVPIWVAQKSEINAPTE